MKIVLIILLCLSILLPGHLLAKGPNEKEMKEKANEMSLLGQLDKANGIVGEKTNFSTEKTDAGGWDGTSLFLSMIWGAFGGGYFIYGKKVSSAAFMFCGIGLCVFPMFVSNTTTSLVLGILMTVIPFKVDI